MPGLFSCLWSLFTRSDLEGLTRRASRTAYEVSDQYALDSSYVYMYLKSDVERRYVVITVCSWKLNFFCTTVIFHFAKYKQMIPLLLWMWDVCVDAQKMLSMRVHEGWIPCSDVTVLQLTCVIVTVLFLPTDTQYNTVHVLLMLLMVFHFLFQGPWRCGDRGWILPEKWRREGACKKKRITGDEVQYTGSRSMYGPSSHL